MTIQSKRHGGGKPCNTNAVKYVIRPKKSARRMLRVFIRRVEEKEGSDTTVWEDIEILRTLSVAASCHD